MRAGKAPRKSAGFTLVETLVALLLVVMMTTVVAVGIQASVRVLAQDTFAAESQSVADTINKALSDVLRYAQDVETDGENGLVKTYSCPAYGINGGKMRVGKPDEEQDKEQDEPGQIYLTDGKNFTLLNSGAYSGLRVVPPDSTLDTLSDNEDKNEDKFELYYKDGVFSGSYRLYDEKNRLLSQEYPFSFRTVNG
jgi:type II secretory pathway pseudopilin PulG